jgi:hypothetical protein
MNNANEYNDGTVSKEQFANQWLFDIVAGNPSSVELGHRFAQKLITQWLDVSENTDDLVYCDGAGDGGIDIAYLERGESTEADEAETQGHTWYLVQSKYGTAFQGQKTLVDEGRKVIDTLDGRRPRLSALSDALLQRLTTFRSQASSRDRIVLVYATCEALTDDQKRAMSDVRAIGRARLGPMFDVESVSIETVYERNLENIEQARIRILLKANLVASGDELLVGSTPLMDLYTFLRTYRAKTEDLDRLYEKNVRKFLGMRGKVNKAIQETLDSNPERFGLYNNGITIVVEDFKPKGADGWELKEPFIVNGCQTTRTIWEVFYRRLEAGGTGASEALQQWQDRAERGVVVTKVVKVGVEGEQLLEKITRNTNTQNAIREKDFLALTADFKTWQKAMEEIQDTYLEIQRGGWDSRRALQKQKPGIKQFAKVANAFDLLKVYGAGWLGEAGMAWGKNPPFLPNGSVFRRIVNATDLPDSERFGVDDLYAAYQLQQAADDRDFGRGAAKVSRRQTRFLFYMVAIDLLRDALNRGRFPTTNKQVTRALKTLFEPATRNVADNFLDTAVDAIDSYMTANTDDNIFDEPAFRAVNSDLNAFLKWEKLGKTEADCPRLRNLLAVTKSVMGKRIQGQSSIREDILKALEPVTTTP